MTANQVVHVAEGAQLLLDPEARDMILLVGLLSSLGLLTRLKLLDVGRMVASAGLGRDRGAADHSRIVPVPRAHLVRPMGLHHLLWVHHASLAVPTTSSHLELLHLPAAHPPSLAMSSVHHLRIHDPVWRDALQLLLHVLLLRWAKPWMIPRAHVDGLGIGLPKVHGMGWMLGEALIALLFPPGGRLTLLRHLLHRPVLRLPLHL